MPKLDPTLIAVRIFLILFLAIFTNSCGTTMAYECLVGPECDSDPSIGYYHAVKTDIALWNMPEEAGVGQFGTWFQRGIVIGDTPLSFIVDTLLLPFQYLNSVIRGDRTEVTHPKKI